MTTNVTAALAMHVDRYAQALNQIPTLRTDNWSDEDKREHEEQMVSLAEDPEQIVFLEGVYLAAVAEAVVAWLKLPEHETTRGRLVGMVEEALTDDED